MRDNDELAQFKRDINLIEFCGSYGYELSSIESSQYSALMRNKGTGDKVVIAKGANQSWIYFSVRDDNDNGTIIEFVQKREHINLGKLRQKLRPWIGRPADKVKTYRNIETVSYNRGRVRHVLNGAEYCISSPYLASRAITPYTLASNRFKNMIRSYEGDTVFFPHYDTEGVSGYEIKNSTFTGFAKHGQRSLWLSQSFPTDTHIAFFESAIDALSYHQIHQPENTRYVSTGGSFSGYQQKVVLKLFKKWQDRPLKIISGFDDDKGGNKYHEILEELAIGLEVERSIAIKPYKDWNDYLKSLDQTGSVE